MFDRGEGRPPFQGAILMAAGKVHEWLMANRTSVRLAFILRFLSMGVNTLMSLVWTPLLLRAMGKELFGLFFVFQAVPRLGGLGDLGLTGAIAIRVGQMIGRGEYERLRPFLAATRALVAIVAPVLGFIFLALSPFLPKWLGFQNAPGAGSLVLLFQTGALWLSVLIAAGYFHSVNTAYATMTWPVLPTLVLSQLSILAHWLLARAGAPLWVQNLAYVASTFGTMVMIWWMLKLAHPWLGELRPIRIDKAVWRELISTSGWAYLYGLGNLIYTTTDRLVINSGFGAGMVPPYMLNAKFCELAVQLALTASAVGIPKITQWMASTVPADRDRVKIEIRRLNTFQILLGVAAALAYLVANDLFIRLWVGPDYLCPPLWQFAFALNLAVTVSGDVSIQVAGLCGRDGLRRAGLAVGSTGLLNLGLSILSMKLGSIAGIALATVLAQSVLSLVLGRQLCHFLGLPFGSWLARSWLLPILAISAAWWMRTVLPPNSFATGSALAGCCLIVGVLLARMIGFNTSLLQHEWTILKKVFKSER